MRPLSESTPMRLVLSLTALTLATLPLPAVASSCAEQIGTIARRLDSAGAVQVAGLQAGHTLRTGSPRGVTAARLDAPSDPDTVSTADHVVIARTLILRAGEEDRRGDKRACENTMTEAKGMIGALP
ncbi:hypothetical protein MKK69_18365 [Methylobacterium sp. J-026]|uniref:hypothetical protein n=1 Tax=Methylobacterium sp. J-026 TaxID=2836624 RepID=UPI001FBA6A0E|nr:hypothetical protein [Methylobacterium sp. J-026]MCJ2135990.1 hypothetical protein [Methylobacterium sp. J-026]